MKGVKSLKDKQVYAVVDLETTGTDPTSDRIIQFGCVLVQDGKIIANFATDVNPNQVVPKQIQSLTGISNTQVQKAPYFEDVAHTIYHYLEDTSGGPDLLHRRGEYQRRCPAQYRQPAPRSGRIYRKKWHSNRCFWWMDR